MSHPAVHPVDVLLEPPAENAAAPPGVRMGYIKGLPGTKLGLVLRASQIFFATVAVVVMSTTSDFSSVLVFCLLVAFSGLQIFWSLAMALTNIRAISLKRKFQNRPAVIIFFAGDMVAGRSCQRILDTSGERMTRHHHKRTHNSSLEARSLLYSCSLEPVHLLVSLFSLMLINRIVP
ncbi:CASP-like protein 5A2 isoform X3 [Spinacia oleracea]|uniref:CASP-like protein n=1 Tax=Spinacia oleracea TaxID=3562 RepID=A0ABM3QJ03_SPIOL|nr:CASP-like protein 5A2 isoform X3 [Spinacia oleracea]